MTNKSLLTEYTRKMKLLKKTSDTEISHVEADGLLCDLLIKLGYNDVVEEWGGVGKWYA